MYEEFYHLTERPFSLSPDPSFLYFSKSHSRAMNILEYGVESNAAITVVSGEVGTGKTTLVRNLIDNLSDDVLVGLISHTQNDFDDLMKWVMLAFDVETDETDNVKLYKMFIEMIRRERAAGKKVLLIIDEAQNLGAAALENIRMLTNINVDKEPALQLILVGQPELIKILQRDELRQFAQRVSADFFLKPLSLKETAEYIRSRLETAGGLRNLFKSNAIMRIHEVSGGIPRLINTLCDLAMVYAYADEMPIITLPIVNDVIKDRKIGGLVFRDNTPDTPSAIKKRLAEQEVANALASKNIRKDKVDIELVS